MLEFISKPWPWYVGGPLIAIVMAVMLLIGKRFGISKSFEVACSIGGASKLSDYFDLNWKEYDWLIVLVIGTIGGGFLANEFFVSNEPIDLSQKTVLSLKQLGISNAGETFLPLEVFSWSSLLTIKGIIFIGVGGFLVGFGTRYAGGCTSGHSISGMSELQLPSLIATIGFFIGGLITTHLLIPIVLAL